jgi:sec-independent protein translocase protein TatA
MLVGLELDDKAFSIGFFEALRRRLYLLGAEDHGLSEIAVKKSRFLVKFSSNLSLNIFVAGSIVIHNKTIKIKLNVYICIHMNSIFLFISGPEIFIIILIVVMLFGADKIPEIARGLGKTMSQVKSATNDIKSEIKKSADRQGIDTEFTKDIKDGISKVKDNIDDMTGPIKRL